MVEVLVKADEFCLLSIPHWSTCMTKSEWAAWAQVFVGIVAIWAAWKAVQAAHRLAVESRKVNRRTDRLTDNFHEVDKLYMRLFALVRAGEGIAENLNSGQPVEKAERTRFEALAKTITDANYGDFPVMELVEPLTTIQLHLRSSLDAMNRHDELHRRRASRGFEEAAADAASALASAMAELPKFDRWLVQQSRHLGDWL